jgi:uncharacterized protein YjbI with pentapeptide repeats
VAFVGAQLHGARFRESNLTGADLRGALSGLNDEDLRGIFGHCTGCDARDANLDGYDLSGISIVGMDLRGAQARGVRFAGADLEGVDFNGADLRQADFRNARLCSRSRDGRISCADLRAANLQGADLRGALLCDDGPKPQRCEPASAVTLRVGSRANLDGAIL